MELHHHFIKLLLTLHHHYIMFPAAMSFPASGMESAYRNNLKDVAKMLRTKHEDNYMVSGLWSKRLTIVYGFRPESEKFDFDKTAYHQKGHVERSIMVQISAL